MHFRVTTSPALEPVTRAEAKIVARIEDAFTDHDTYIDSLILGARKQAEDSTKRALITQTVTAHLDGFPRSNSIELPLPELQSVASVKYYDSNNSLTTLSASEYQVVGTKTPGKIELNDGVSWPTTYKKDHAVEIIYVAGYGDNPADVPEDIRLAIMALVTHQYDHPGIVETAPGIVSVAVPLSFDAVMRKYRIAYF